MPQVDKTPIDPTVQAKNRRIFLLLLAFFITPTLLGYLAYFGGWIDSSNTVNKGTLITPPIAIESLNLQLDDGKLFAQPTLRGKWWLLYQLPQTCEQSCINSLLQIRQVRLALGKNTERVSRVLIVESGSLSSNPELAGHIKSEHGDALMLAPSEEILAKNTPLESGVIYIVDPLGNIILSYPGYKDAEEAILKAKLILKDLNKLLKVSRIG